MRQKMLRVFLMTLLALTALSFGNAFSPVAVRAQEVPMSLPRVTIHINGGQAEIDKMNASEDHSYHCTGTIDITVPDGFKYTDSSADLQSVSGLSMDIRGRGNTTWEFKGNKKPYKIKLDKKKAILGMKANKHWALVANVFDPSMMRNRITLWLGKELGMEFTPSGYPVDVYMENNYLGSYLLCETVRVAPARVNIDELTAEDNEGTNLTGGYLLSCLQDTGSVATFTTEKGDDLQNHTPSFDPEDGGFYGTAAQKKYIRDYVQEAEYALYEGEVSDENEPSGYRKLDYRDYFDMKAASLYWLMQEFSKNGDAFTTGSSYFYKTRDKEGQPGKIFWGPLWDFDFAWDRSDFSQDDPFESNFGWYTAMMTDQGPDGLPNQIQKDWPVLKEKLLEITREGGLLDRYYEEMKVSYAADYEKNHYEGFENFSAAVDTLRDWINRRITWMDSTIGTLDNYSHKVFLKKDAEDAHPQVYCVRTGQNFENSAITPEKDGYVFLGWYTDQGENLKNCSIEEDTVATARYISEKEAILPEKFYLGYKEKWANFKEGELLTQYTILPEDAQDKNVKWTSSDESVATVDRTEKVKFEKVGDVTITGTLRNGLKASFLLHIRNPEDLASPASINLPEDVIYMKPGEVRQIVPKVSPENACFYLAILTYDDDIISVDENGVVVANAEGKATIEITAISDLPDDDTQVTTSCQVIVGEDKKPEPQKLAAPKIKTRAVKRGRMKVSWNAVKGASGYRLEYRKKGGKWTSRNVTARSAVVKGLKTGKLYQFRVAAIRKTGKTREIGDYSPVRCRYYRQLAAVGCAGRKKAIRVSWKKIRGVKNYRILVSGNKQFKKAKVFNVKTAKNAYLVKGLKARKRYYVKILPLKKTGGKTYLGICRKKRVQTK